MPFFNFRRSGQSPAASAAPAASTDSVEVIRKRARHRLIGAAVLVLAGIIGFPLVFDTQPRPVAVDIPIDIPGKTAAKPLTLPARDASAPSTPSLPATAAAPVAPVAPVAVAPAQPASSARVAAAGSLAPKEEIITEKPAAAPVPRASAAIKNEAKPEPKPAVPADDGARAKALLDGKPVAPAAVAESEGRLVVQVGAFADVAKAREARLKLEKAGLKTYTQVAETKDGKRIRVRVGPFATRADAEKAASKIKGLDLPAAILTL